MYFLQYSNFPLINVSTLSQLPSVVPYRVTVSRPLQDFPFLLLPNVLDLSPTSFPVRQSSTSETILFQVPLFIYRLESEFHGRLEHGCR